MPKPYPAEFRRRALNLVAADRTVRDVAASLGIAESCLYGWKSRDLIDRGLKPGTTSRESAELAEAPRRIRELEDARSCARPPRRSRGGAHKKGGSSSWPSWSMRECRPNGPVANSRSSVGLLRVAASSTVAAGNPARLAERHHRCGAQSLASNQWWPPHPCRARPRPEHSGRL